MMQGLHPQQQQLAALLAAALPKDASTSTSASASASTATAVPAANADDADSSRLAAINSLHRAIIYPPNSLLVAHSASFLAQGFSQLLSDKSYSVRQSAVLAYAALCAVVSSIPVGSTARQNHLLLGTLVDRFIAWALPLLTNVCAGDGTIELSLEGLREFLNVGDVGGIERYALPILKACQQLLEDERTSLNLLHRLLPTLTLISLKFSRLFQPHFLDIVDLLLGWAMLPDFAESDRRVIMDSFLQFQKHWVSNLQFSLGLLSKFLGDMDMLLQDGTHGGSQHFRRLLALLSCFSTVLQSTASGLLEINLLEQIIEPLSKMLPRLLGCLSMVGQKFGWSIWIGDLWKCLTLLAEILCERFSTFYPIVVDILFQSLDQGSSAQSIRFGKLTFLQVHGVLKTNLQLLSLQKFGLMPSSVQKILKFDSPISQLRLHPNHLVTGSSAATYVFLLQHGNDEIVQQAITLLTEDLEHLKALLGKTLYDADAADNAKYSGMYTKSELFALFKFDLKVLLTSISVDGCNSMVGMPKVNLYMKRLEKMVSFIIEKLNPFDSPIQAVVELQVRIFKTLTWLSMVNFSGRRSIQNQTCNKSHMDSGTGKVFIGNSSRNGHISIVVDLFKEFGETIIKALLFSSPLSVKLVALEWVQKFCENLISIDGNLSVNINSFEDYGFVGLLGNITFVVLEAGFDPEPKVRLLAAQVLSLLLQARLVHPMYFYSLAEAILEKLGDPDIEVRNAFIRLLSDALPTTVYMCGLCDYGTYATRRPRILMVGIDAELYWKQAFALKPLPQQLHAQQLVSVLSYISQRWKVPLSSWIQRFVHTCRSSKGSVLCQLEDTGTAGDGGLWLDIKVDEEILGKFCSVNILAGAWWAIHEAARYCTSTRLRTNLGGPTQTFAAIERMLLDIAHVLQIDNEESDRGLSIIGSSAAHLLPMRLLLDFVEALKKNVYNAYEGSVVFPCTSRQSALFFRTNKKVCEEWFSRICEPMMNAGLALQCHDAAIQYCNLRLMELKNLLTTSSKEKSRTQAAESLHSVNGRFLGDALRILRSMTLSMCRNHESEALIGIQKWVSMKFCSLLVNENQDSSTGVLRPLQWITGLIYQAEGRYEKAAAYFSHLLETEESLSTMGSDGVQFAIARIIESYSALCDWKSLETWLLELQMLRSKFAGKSYSGALTTAGNEMNGIHALACFDEGDFQASWAYLDLTPKSSSELTLDPRLSLQRSEQMLLQALLHFDGNVDTVPHDLQKAKLVLEEVLSSLPFDGLPEAVAYTTQLQCISAVEEGCELRVNHNQTKHRHSIFTSYVLSTDPLVKEHYQDCSQWLKVLRVYRTISQTAPITLKLSMDMLRLARKQGNYMLANRLYLFLGDNVHHCSDESYCDMLVSSLQYEEILLMFAENKIEEAFENIWSFLSPTLSVSNYTGKSVGDNVLKAKACLKLSCWLRKDFPGLNLKNSILNMQRDLIADGLSSAGPSPFVDRNISSNSNFHTIVEGVVGGLTKLSTQLCPTMGKAWICYASWCFRQAKNFRAHLCDKVCHSSIFSPFVPEQTLERFKLNEDEIKMVEFEIMKLFKGCDINSLDDERAAWSICPEQNKLLSADNPLGALMQKVVDVIEIAVGGSGAESIDGETVSSTLAPQLLKVLQHANVGVEETTLGSVVDKLLEFWWLVRQRRISLFGHAAHGFIEYLSYSSSKLSDCQFLDAGFEPMKQKTGSYTLKATLYVLHILLNHGLDLKETLEPALSTVPLLPWQEVSPQLFARLSSHPNKVVRKQLEGLLMRLAKQSPWSIVYPTLVDVNAYEEDHSEELQHILGCLTELYPRLVQDVQLMIDELGNVTVLWEELWLSTLQDLHTDVIRRINVLKEEAARIAENSTLSQSEKKKINAAKYSAVMAPIVVALERRLASTSRKPETLHESWFHLEYREQLKAAILTFKTPPVSASAIEEVWRPFENIAASLSSQQRKSSIAFQEVAPRLAMLSSSEIPMPGVMKQCEAIGSERSLSSTLEGVVTIASFSPQVTILSTKTKPKKLVMLGSDGNMYTFLLKGREDLRLDARIMQLLQAVNSFLHSSSETHRRALGIRYYSVTPISGRAGLIQWVDNVISIYSIFKSWQNRAQLAQHSALGAGNAKCSAPPPVPRPSDMFYGKIIPALKEKGIRRVISRRDWPHEVKRKVLFDLMKEVPRQLLHQELWCASEGFKAFSSKLKRYSGSVATMSMVGHILGLGDRHLDNILLDFSSGEVVHIDYNVCFDKGHRLKVPEIVPFRLTQTIEAALGLTGIEGTFRANCEAVVGVLRKNKDIILMLLEVFVWDPLVEWTRGNFHDDSAIGGEERKGMELAVSLSLFATRVQEIRVPLQEHRDLLLGTLPAVESALERFSDILGQYELLSVLFYQADEERSSLVQHETSAKSVIAEATCNSEKVHALFEVQAREFAQAKTLITEKAQEASKWIEQHGRILDALRSNLIPEIKASINMSSMSDQISLKSAVIAAGVPLTIVPEPTLAQCHDIDQEISHLISELDSGLSSAVTGVQAYSLALQRILPLNYLTTSAVHGWTQVLQFSVNTLSSEVLSLARRQAAELIAKVQGDNPDLIKMRHDDLCVKVQKYAIEIQKLREESSELVSSIGSDNELTAKDRLLSAFIQYMQSADFLRKEDISSFLQFIESNSDGKENGGVKEEVKDRKQKMLSVLSTASNLLYTDIGHRVIGIVGGIATGKNENNILQSDIGTIFSMFEEQVEKCVLLDGFLNELWQHIGSEIPGQISNTFLSFHSVDNQAAIFRTVLLSCKSFIEQMTEIVLADVMRFAISFNTEVMDAFSLISQVRGTIDTALERLMEVELDRASLAELEQNYFVKVGLITEKQLALEEAAVKGRDHLSWEEAEELASQEEACKAQLDALHQSWNRKDVQTSFLKKKEAEIINSFLSCEHHFQSLLSVEEHVVPHRSRSKALLGILARPLSELESVDKILSSLGVSGSSHPDWIPNLLDLIGRGNLISELVWKSGSLLDGLSFFIWKIDVLDSIIGSCLHDIASYIDQNLGFEQLFDAVKRKLEIQLQEQVCRYLKQRFAPALLSWLDRESERLKLLTDGAKELGSDQMKMDTMAVRRVQTILEEYCNSYETVRAARSAASIMKKQENELKESLRKSFLEIVQMEWMQDFVLTQSHDSHTMIQNFFGSDELHPIILNLQRQTLLDGIQSAVSKITRSIECLHSCEQTYIAVEGQLDREMEWACGGPNSGSTGISSSKATGIPPQFHNHLRRRRQLLSEAREKASNIVNLCISILEFEASRDGMLQVTGEAYPFRSNSDTRKWQQAYFSALTRLEVTYHSFTRAEHELKLAQSSMEAASNSLYSATNELSIALLKAKSASGDIQSTVLAMRDCAYEASVSLSDFVRVLKGHTALTSESGSMLEEVLAITEDLHDIHKLGKEAAAVHRAFMEGLSKINAILLPLESVLSKDVSAMTEALSREKETKIEVSPIHGQAIYQSYCSRVREACRIFKQSISSLVESVEGLHSLLNELALAANLHAGNLNKAHEGSGESQEMKSQEVSLVKPDAAGGTAELGEMGRHILSQSDGDSYKDVFGSEGLSLQEKEWISPPNSVESCTAEFAFTSTGANSPDTLSIQACLTDNLSNHSDNIDAQDDLNSVVSSQNDAILHPKQPEASEMKSELDVLEIYLKAVEHAIDEAINGPVEPPNTLNKEILKKNGDTDAVSIEADIQDSPAPHTHVESTVVRGKNTYALSVLERVKMKLDGWETVENREMGIAEQVDSLLKQATSIDNLCSMYEGWTPWI